MVTCNMRLPSLSSDNGLGGGGGGFKAIRTPEISLTDLVTSFPEERLLIDQG